MATFADFVAEAGGVGAPRDSAAHLRSRLAQELERGDDELRRPRSGSREAPVVVAFAADARGVAVACPAPPGLRADPAETSDRGWLVVAAAVGAAVAGAEPGPPAPGGAPALSAGEVEGHLLLSVLAGPGRKADAELAALHFDDATAPVDRLRAAGVPVPAHALERGRDLRAPVGATHPLRVAEIVARLGGQPADQDSVDTLEEETLRLLGVGEGATAAHDDPDPVRRVARRILRRLDGMGKWGGYHTDFVHLSRGFRGNERALASAVGEALVEAGLLSEKRSVGQRHVFLNPRRSGEIRRLIVVGEVPAGLRLPRR